MRTWQTSPVPSHTLRRRWPWLRAAALLLLTWICAQATPARAGNRTRSDSARDVLPGCDSLRAALERAATLSSQGAYSDAIECLAPFESTDAATPSPGNDPSIGQQLALAIAWARAFDGAHEAARVGLGQAISSWPTHLPLSIARARITHWSGRHALARRNIRQLLEHESSRDELWALLGAVELALGNQRSARAAFLRATALHPDNEEANAGLRKLSGPALLRFGGELTYGWTRVAGTDAIALRAHLELMLRSWARVDLDYARGALGLGTRALARGRRGHFLRAGLSGWLRDRWVYGVALSGMRYGGTWYGAGEVSLGRKLGQRWTLLGAGQLSRALTAENPQWTAVARFDAVARVRTRHTLGLAGIFTFRPVATGPLGSNATIVGLATWTRRPSPADSLPVLLRASVGVSAKPTAAPSLGYVLATSAQLPLTPRIRALIEVESTGPLPLAQNPQPPPWAHVARAGVAFRW